MQKTKIFDEPAFWQLYDNYIIAPNSGLKKQLMSMVALHPAIFELARLEKGWKNILAWEALDSVHLETENKRFFIPCGEIIIQQSHWDRDIHMYVADVVKQKIISMFDEQKSYALKCLHEEMRFWPLQT